MPGAFAAPFADRAALKTAVDNCLAVDATGACCNRGADCGAAGTTEMADWDVSLVTDMSFLFNGKGSFNADISRWDVSSVTNMQGMFYSARAFNADISRWDVSSVANMQGMFYSARAFNADISRWDVSSVTNMFYMLRDANVFNADVSGWDVSSVTNMYQMFIYAYKFNADISRWDVSSVMNMAYMFYEARAFNADISRWDVSSVTNMYQMFYQASKFNADISRWDVSSVTNMYQMFYQAGNFNADISRWDVSSVTNMNDMFEQAGNFNADITRWDTSSVTNFGDMFYSATAWASRFHNCGYHGSSSHQACGEVASYLASSGSNLGPPAAWVRKDNACDASTPPLNGGVGNCTDTLVSGTSCVPTCDTLYVLEGVTSCTDRVLTEKAVCALDVTTRAELKAAVDACVGDRLCEQAMPLWNVSRVTDMSFLFKGKSKFNVDISQWEMSQVTTAAGMFEGASSFHQDIRGWALASGSDTTGMFTGADTWLSRASRADGSATTDGPPTAWVASGRCFINEHVQSGWCVACGAGEYNAPGDDPALGVDTRCDAFPNRTALKTAVDSCLGADGDPTGVACCSKPLVDCGAAGTVEMAYWEVSLVTDMSELFFDKRSFNADISRWDVSSVTNMYRMFGQAFNFNADISRWDVSSVTNMGQMLFWCSKFNADISRWDVSSVTTMENMFRLAKVFDADITRWDTSSVTDSNRMFESANAWYQSSTTAALPGGGEVSSWHRAAPASVHPPRGFAKDNACDASYPPDNGGVGNCTDTLVSGTSCVPTCNPGYVLQGVTSCTNRVLTRKGFVRLADCGSRRAEGGGGRVSGCGAVGGEVLLLRPQVLVR